MPAGCARWSVRVNEALTGSRQLRGMVAIGGVRRDWSPAQCDLLRDAIPQLEREFDDLVALVRSSDSTRDRLERTGILRPETARALGIVGVGGRASGVDLDVRRDHPYAAYEQLPVHACRSTPQATCCTGCKCASTKCVSRS